MGSFTFWFPNQSVVRNIRSSHYKVHGHRKNAVPTPIRVLLPHEVLDALARSSPFAFGSILLGNLDDSTRIAFFEHLSHLEPYKNHPVILAEKGKWDKLIGCCIHGDGAQMYREDEFFVWSWGSVFGASGCIHDVLLSKWPIAVVPERYMRRASVSQFD